MCGISGIKRFGADIITEDQINILLCSLQHRGTDASGIAMMKGAEIQIFKSDREAWKFVAMKEYKDFIATHLSPETDTVLLHTRAYTVGNPRENKNNHPLSLGAGAIVHNGCISNHITTFARLGCERSAETDSDVIRAIVDKHGITTDAIKEMAKLDGSIAAACVHPDYPGKLMLLQSGSPLVIAQAGTHLMWASEKTAIQRASRPWDQWQGFWVQENKAPVRWASAHTDSAFIIGPRGLEFHMEFKPCRYYSQPDYTRLRRNFASRQAEIDRDALKFAPALPKTVTETVKGKATIYYMCRNPQCEIRMAIPDKFANFPLHQLRCPDCSWFIAGDPAAKTAVKA